MAAKCSFLSQSMKTGSIVYLNGSNVQSKLEINEENEYLTSVNGKQKRCTVCCKPSVCDTFHKGFTKTSNRKTHRRIHTGDKPHVCDTFEKGFTRNIYLKIHQRVHKKKPSVCGTLQKRFTQKRLRAGEKLECTTQHRRSADSSFLN